MIEDFGKIIFLLLQLNLLCLIINFQFKWSFWTTSEGAFSLELWFYALLSPRQAGHFQEFSTIQNAVSIYCLKRDLSCFVSKDFAHYLQIVIQETPLPLLFHRRERNCFDFRREKLTLLLQRLFAIVVRLCLRKMINSYDCLRRNLFARLSR